MSRVFVFIAGCAIGYLLVQPKRASHPLLPAWKEEKDGTYSLFGRPVVDMRGTADAATVTWTSRDGSVTWSSE